jgi:hypothetical protein
MCGGDIWSRFRELAFEFAEGNSIKNLHTYCRPTQQILLFPSTYATRFGSTDHPQAFKYITLKIKMHVYCTFVRFHKF